MAEAERREAATERDSDSSVPTPTYAPAAVLVVLLGMLKAMCRPSRKNSAERLSALLGAGATRRGPAAKVAKVFNPRDPRIRDVGRASSAVVL
jgi:hypothetical protein